MNKIDTSTEAPVTLTHQQKLNALSLRFYQGLKWLPEPGHYYTTSRADLELYRIVKIEDGSVFTRYCDREKSTVVSQWDEAEFTTEGFGVKRVWVPDFVLASSQPSPQPITVQDAAVSDVLAERARQISAEGWTPEHDDAHEAGELARAAACYAMQAALDNIGTPGLADATRHMVREMWPWSREWWKPADHRRDLVKAGALILAEIQRLDRAALRAITEGRE